MDPDELLSLGPALNLETMERQGRFDAEFGDPLRWKRFVAAIARCPGVSITGAFVGDRLACYAVHCRDGTTQHRLFRMSRTQDLKQHVPAALDFWLLCEAGKDPGIETVENGYFRKSLCSYKISMGYEEIPTQVATVFHPWLRFGLGQRWAGDALLAGAHALPDSTRLTALAEFVREIRSRTRRR